jgi:DNA internalization-related competence protein ComEC/Rec2
MSAGPEPEVGLWWLAGGLFLGIVGGCRLATTWMPPTPMMVGWLAVALAIGMLVVLRNRTRLRWSIGIAAAVAGLCLGAADQRAEQSIQDALDGADQTAVRLRAAASEGWTTDRWGYRTRVRVDAADRTGVALPLPQPSRLEVRGVQDPTALPGPGVPFEVLAEVKGPAASPLLVIASPRLIRTLGPARGIPALRQYLVDGLTEAAGSDVHRLRAAATAAALALGRRDELPEHRREGWRRSGLAHAFAVSGLHVGVVSGVLWMLAVGMGLTPNRIRMVLLVLVPAYAILAGAAPSAVRATTMVALYLVARLLGRAVDPLAAVCLAATSLMIWDPGLAEGPGFQLTVAVTAALIRWTMPVADRLRGPAWFRGALAAPLVAALASSPIVAIHFGRVVPLGLAANFAAPVLLSLMIPVAVATTAISLVITPLAAELLAVLGRIEDLLWWIGGLGRLWNPAVAPVPGMVVGALAVVGWAALRRRSGARWAALVWVGMWLSVPVVQSLLAGPGPQRAEVLSIGDGTSIVVSSGERAILLDGGRSPHQAHRLLLASGVRRLAAVIVSHGDADHLGGLPTILERHRVDAVVMPTWLAAEPAAAPLIRSARGRDVPVRHMARGSRLVLGGIPVTCLWPPATAPPEAENERSLVLRLGLPSGSVLTTGDIGTATERVLGQRTDLACEVLIAPHHGSRSSSSARFLDQADPHVVLIPAGPWNRFGHPHRDVLRRLADRELPYCAPILDPVCRAVPGDAGWVLDTGDER